MSLPVGVIVCVVDTVSIVMIHCHLQEVFILGTCALMVDQAGSLQKLFTAVWTVEGFHADMYPFMRIHI